MSSQAVKVDKTIEKLINSKGLNYTLENINAWLLNKEEHCRAYDNDLEEIKMLKSIQTILNQAINNYK